MQTGEYFSKLPEHQQLLFEYLEGIPQTRGHHLIDVSTGGGKTYICLNYWCAEGHKHFRKLFFVLPQHKNIHSAVNDFENSKQLTGYGGSYMTVKGVDCINDFLETNNSFHVLNDLRNQLLELEGEVRNVDSQQYNKLISLYNYSVSDYFVYFENDPSKLSPLYQQVKYGYIKVDEAVKLLRQANVNVRKVGGIVHISDDCIMREGFVQYVGLLQEEVNDLLPE